jgi:hypothetical protein
VANTEESFATDPSFLAAVVMGEHHQDEEHLEPHRWHDEEIDGHQVLEVIFQKRPPGRRGRMTRATAVLVHCGLGHLNTKLFEFTDNPGRAPSRVGLGDTANPIADFLGDSRSAWFAALGESSPVITKAAPLPFGDGPRPQEDPKCLPPPLCALAI